MLAGSVCALAFAAQPALAHHPGAPAHLPEDAARGQVHRDLVQSAEPHCRGLLMGARSGVCTHGPDPAPVGRDVRVPRSTAELRAEAGLAPMPSLPATTPGTTTAPTDGTGAIVCSGDGVAGKRIEVLYVRPADKTDRFDSMKDALGQYAIGADRQLNASAAETGGSRHWRFVTDPDPAGAAPCVLRITKVDVGSADDDSFDASVDAVKARGYNSASRKYLMFVESNVYCGIGSLYRDSQPGQTNINNGSYAQYARTDAACWNYAEAHELMHNLGGVQDDAPNATPGFHCSDEADEMCYDDDGNGPVVMRSVCAGRDGSLFDCNHDDYFFAGTPPATNYLATHWNTAFSAFLIAPAGTPPPTTTTNEQVSGSFKRNALSAVFTRTVQPGPLRGVATGTTKRTPATITLTLRDAQGRVLDSKTGTSVDVQATAAAAGAHSWTISGASGVSYKLTLTYTTA